MAANFSPTVSLSRSQGEAKDAHFGWSDSEGQIGLLTLCALVAGVTFAYWRVLVDTAQFWDQPQYSHGWIVPLIGAYLMWCRRPKPIEKSHAFRLDLGIITIDFTLVAGAAAAAAAMYVGTVTGMPGFVGAGMSLFAGLCVGWLVMGQPFCPLGNEWRFDWEDTPERVLLSLTGVATALVAIAYVGLSIEGTLPQSLTLPAMLLAVLLYGGGLLGISLTALAGPMNRTGAETLCATVALVGTSLVWVQASLLDMMPLMRICFIVSLLGVVMMVGGRRLVQWAGPALVFLVFMFPLPSVAEKSLLPLLQKLAAMASTTVLQVMGLPIYRVGSQMVIEGLSTPMQLEVAEACSGLRMSTIFGAMTVAMVFLINRPWWDKFTILLSAIPVALLVNVIRIIVTALVFYAYPENEDLHKFVHDYAGFAMMPVAMGILYLELIILSNLSVPEEGVDYQQASGGGVMPRV